TRQPARPPIPAAWPHPTGRPRPDRCRPARQSSPPPVAPVDDPTKAGPLRRSWTAQPVVVGGPPCPCPPGPLSGGPGSAGGPLPGGVTVVGGPGTLGGEAWPWLWASALAPAVISAQ